MKLVKAKLDLTETRGQLMLGMLVLFFYICFINGSVATRHFILVNQANFLVPYLINLSIFFLCAFLVVLITQEITTRYGNRLGTAPAIWAGFIFAANPMNLLVNLLAMTAISESNQVLELLFCLFLLSAIWFLMRFLAWREVMYLRLSVWTCLTIVGLSCYRLWCNQSSLLQINWILAQDLIQVAFPGLSMHTAKAAGTILLSAYIVSVLVLGMRLASNSVDWQTIGKILLGILAYACFGTMLFGLLGSMSGPGNFLFLAAPFSILLVLFAFPTLDHSLRSNTRVTATLGLLSLSTIFVIFNYMVRIEVNDLSRLPHTLWHPH